jgi:hypothetical protein
MQKRFRWFSLFGLIILLVIIGVFASQAQEWYAVSVRCNLATVTGHIDSDAPYMLITVATVSDVSQVLASRVIRVRPDGNYSAHINFPRQAENSYLMVTIGQWDGQEYVSVPSGADYYCSQSGGMPSGGPTPAPTPTP